MSLFSPRSSRICVHRPILSRRIRSTTSTPPGADGTAAGGKGAAAGRAGTTAEVEAAGSDCPAAGTGGSAAGVDGTAAGVEGTPPGGVVANSAVTGYLPVSERAANPRERGADGSPNVAIEGNS